MSVDIGAIRAAAQRAKPWPSVVMDPDEVLALCDMAERPTTPLADDVQAAVVLGEEAARSLVQMAADAQYPPLARYGEALSTIITALRDMDPEKLTPEQALREIVGNVPHPAVIIAELETAYGYTIVPIAERDAGRALYEAVRHDWGNLEAVKAYKEVLDE